MESKLCQEQWASTKGTQTDSSPDIETWQNCDFSKRHSSKDTRGTAKTWQIGRPNTTKPAHVKPPTITDPQPKHRSKSRSNNKNRSRSMTKSRGNSRNMSQEQEEAQEQELEQREAAHTANTTKRAHEKPSGITKI